MGGDHFGRRECAGDAQLARRPGCRDHVRMQAGADNEFRAGCDGIFGFLCCCHRPRAKQQTCRAVSVLEFSEDTGSIGAGHGDFDDGNAAGDHGFHHGMRLRYGLGAQHGHEADAFDDLCCCFMHLGIPLWPT